MKQLTIEDIKEMIVPILKAAARFSEEFRNAHPEIAWKKIIGMRNMIIHDYSGIRLDILWQTIQQSVPELKEQIETLV